MVSWSAAWWMVYCPVTQNASNFTYEQVTAHIAITAIYPHQYCADDCSDYIQSLVLLLHLIHPVCVCVDNHIKGHMTGQFGV